MEQTVLGSCFLPHKLVSAQQTLKQIQLYGIKCRPHYYTIIIYLVVTVCCVSSIMLKVHRTLPCKLELLLFLTRKNLHSGEAVTGVRCEV